MRRSKVMKTFYRAERKRVNENSKRGEDVHFLNQDIWIKVPPN